MTIEEAVGLVLEAARMAESTGTYVLDIHLQGDKETVFFEV